MSQYTLTPPFRNNLFAGGNGNGRLYVRPNVYLPNSEIDFQTGMLRETRRRTGRTQALRREARQLDTEYVRLQALLQARENETGQAYVAESRRIAADPGRCAGLFGYPACAAGQYHRKAKYRPIAQ